VKISLLALLLIVPAILRAQDESFDAATQTLTVGKGAGTTAQIVLSSNVATKKSQLLNGTWYTYAVPSFRPLDAGGNGILDVMSNGSTPANRIQSWIHTCSTDITLSAANWECMAVRMYPNYGNVGTAALGSGVIRPLSINEFGGNVSVGTSALFPNTLYVAGTLGVAGTINGFLLANASTSNPGFMPALDGIATHFLNGNGQWATPAGGSPGTGCVPGGPTGGLLTDSGAGTCNTLALGTATTVLHGNNLYTQVVSADLAPVLARRICEIPVGDQSASGLIDAQLGPQKRICFIPYGATITEVDVSSDAGVPNVQLGVNHAGTITAVLSAALATASGGAPACSNISGAVGLDGITTCSATLTHPTILQGDYLELVSGSAGGAKLMTIHVVYQVN
jgi:hypothetical protein